jgi:hypothetical protein
LGGFRCLARALLNNLVHEDVGEPPTPPLIKTMKNTLLTTALLAVGSIVSAHALPSLSGSIEFGSFSPAYVTGGTGLADATGIGFVNISGLGSAIVNTGATGSFAGLVGSTAEFYDFTFAPLPVGGAPIWFIDGVFVAFHLNSVTIDQQTATGLSLTGVGVATAPGFAPTPGTFAFSMQGNSGDQTFSFSAGNSVPDSGNTVALLGAALLGFGALSRRKA